MSSTTTEIIHSNHKMAESTTAISKRKMRQIAVLLASSVVVLDGVFALAPHDNTSRMSKHKSSANAVLPPFPKIESSARDRRPTLTLQTENQTRKNKNGQRDTRNILQERTLPEVIPCLSDIFQDDEKTHSITRNTNNELIEDPQRSDTTNRVEPTTSVTEKKEPWKANFKSSIRTQGRIKKEFSTYQEGETPNHKAKRILQALLSTSPKQCNSANVIAALTFSAKALGSRKVEQDEQLRTMLFKIFDILDILLQQRLLTTRQLCNACWAIAKHYDRDNTLLPPPPEKTALSSDEVLGTAVRWEILDELNDNTKDHQYKLDETIDEIARQLTSILEESEDFSSQDLPPEPAKIGEICMTSWAFGKLRPRSTPPGWQIPPQLGKIPSAKSTAEKVARTASLITFEQWGAFGTKKQESDILETQPSLQTTGRLFDAIAASLCRSPEATCVVQSAKANIPESHGCRNCLQYCSWSELANLGWSFASHGRCKSTQAEMLLQGLAREACYRLQKGGKLASDFLIRDIAQLLWSLGTLQADNFRLGDDLVYLVESLSDYLRLGERGPSFGRGRPLARWSCADLVQVALSLAHARIDELPLLRAIYEESHHRLLEGIHNDLCDQEGRGCFLPWEVSILLWAQARLNLKEEQDEIFEEFVVDAPRFLLSAVSGSMHTLAECGIGAQEQANIAWSLTVLEQHQSQDAIEMINRIFHEAAKACKEQHTIQLEHAHQLWQAYFLLEEESPESISDVPAWFAEYLREKWSLEKARDKLSSARHRSLSQTLNLMGVRHFNEHDEDIDVAIVLKGDASWTHETDSIQGNPTGKVLVAVEFDGPNHFTRESDPASKSSRPRALGHTVLKYRLLKKQGWSVVRVPYFEFDKIPFWASMVSKLDDRSTYAT